MQPVIEIIPKNFSIKLKIEQREIQNIAFFSKQVKW